MLGMKPDRIDFGSYLDRSCANRHMNVPDALLGSDKNVLPVFELLRSRSELNQPRAEASHPLRESLGLLEFFL